MGLQGPLGSAEGGCKACGSPEEQAAAAAGRVEVIVTNDSTSCSCPDGAVPGSPKAKKGNAAHQPPPKTNPHAHGKIHPTGAFRFEVGSTM